MSSIVSLKRIQSNLMCKSLFCVYFFLVRFGENEVFVFWSKWTQARMQGDLNVFLNVPTIIFIQIYNFFFKSLLHQQYAWRRGRLPLPHPLDPRLSGLLLHFPPLTALRTYLPVRTYRTLIIIY